MRPLGLYIRRFIFFIALLCLIAAIALLVTNRARPLKAESLLYAQTCLGGWINPGNAAGVPPLSSAAADATVAASVSNTLAPLFCGDFAGDIPAEGQPRHLELQLIARYEPPAAPVVITSQDFASSTGAALDASASSTELLIPISNDATSTPVQEPSAPPDVVSPAPDAAVSPPPNTAAPAPPDPPSSAAPDAAPAPQDSSSSFVPGFLFDALAPAIAHAQEPDATSAVEISQPAVTISGAPAEDPNDALEVLYTFDGQTWASLGRLTSAEIRDNSFEIPIEKELAWGDLSKLQISVRSLAGLGEGTVYLWGMRLSVDYGPAQPAAPTTLLKDGAVIPVSALSSVIVHPDDNTSSTNIAFYLVNDDDTVTYMAETVAHGDAPLSEYYAPPPLPGRYILFQYVNALDQNGTFGCNDLSAALCDHDPRLVMRQAFEVVPDDIVTSTVPTTETSTTTSAATSAAADASSSAVIIEPSSQ